MTTNDAIRGLALTFSGTPIEKVAIPKKFLKSFSATGAELYSAFAYRPSGKTTKVQIILYTDRHEVISREVLRVDLKEGTAAFC